MIPSNTVNTPHSTSPMPNILDTWNQATHHTVLYRYQIYSVHDTRHHTTQYRTVVRYTRYMKPSNTPHSTIPISDILDTWNQATHHTVLYRYLIYSIHETKQHTTQYCTDIGYTRYMKPSNTPHSTISDNTDIGYTRYMKPSNTPHSTVPISDILNTLYQATHHTALYQYRICSICDNKQHTTQYRTYIR